MALRNKEVIGAIFVGHIPLLSCEPCIFVSTSIPLPSSYLSSSYLVLCY
jgi:hypothetical protein